MFESLPSLPLSDRKTGSSADADKPARRVYRSVKSPNTVPFHRYSSLLCNSNFTIFDFKKCPDLEIGVRVHSRSLKVAYHSIDCVHSEPRRCYLTPKKV